MRNGLAIILICLLTNACNTKKINMETLLKEMTNRETITRFPEQNFKVRQQSSYNRASKSKEDSIGWFTNHDFNSSEDDHNFIRIEEKNGEKEWVLMEHNKPGVLVRSWMPFLKPDSPETDIEIKIYLDGAETPTLEGNMLSLFNGDGLIPYPFAHKSLRSSVSYFPIAYAKSCKITTTKRPFFYVFTYREYNDDTNITSFSIDEFNANKALIKETGKKLLNPQIISKENIKSTTLNIEAKGEGSLKLPGSEGAIKTLQLELPKNFKQEALRTTILKVKFDNKETVWCPIGDFFGSGMGLNPYKGWNNIVSEDGVLTCKWLMPYKNSAEVSIENLGDPIDIKLNVELTKYNWDDRSMYFNAAWRGQYPVPTRPYSDWNYVTLKGRGVYVGDALTVMNPVERWWGEGDEKIYIDGEDFPSIFGTGTEDYYGYSWGGKSTDFYEHPFHAQPRANIYNKLNRKTTNERNTKGYSTELRTRALDVMPFDSSLHFDMEVWSWSDCDMGYSVGLMWYGDVDTKSNRKPNKQEVLNIPDTDSIMN